MCVITFGARCRGEINSKKSHEKSTVWGWVNPGVGLDQCFSTTGPRPVPGPGIKYTGLRLILLELITNLNVILYLSTCHTVNIIVLILFMIMPQLIINICISLMYELKKIGKVLTSKSVGTGPSSYEKRIYRTAVSQRLRNTGLDLLEKRKISCY